MSWCMTMRGLEKKSRKLNLEKITLPPACKNSIKANTFKMSFSWAQLWKMTKVVLDTCLLSKREQWIKTSPSKPLISALSVEKRDTLLTTAKPPSTLLPKHSRPFVFNAHYLLRKDTSGKVKVTILSPPNKSRPKKIWVAKSLIEKVMGPSKFGCLKFKLDPPFYVGELQDRWEPLGTW
jgi:hypothetical protein